MVESDGRRWCAVAWLVGLAVAGVVAVAGVFVSWLIVLAGVVGPLTDAAYRATGISPRPDR